MAPGAAAARRSCPAAACAPLRAATRTLPAAQGRRKEKSEPYFSPDAESPPGAGRARGPCRRRAESPPGPAARGFSWAPRRPPPAAAAAAGSGRCSGATSCREYFPRLPARPPRLRTAVLTAAALCPLRSPPPGGWIRSVAACPPRALSPLTACSPSLISDREPAKNSP